MDRGQLARRGAELCGEFKDKYPNWAQPIRVHPAATVIYAELP